MTIAFDFDGVIHKYRDGWQDGSIYDDFNPDIINIINDLLSMGNFVFIMTSRPRNQVKRYFDSFAVLQETFYVSAFNTLSEYSWLENRAIPFEYETFWHYKKFWDKPGVCGICNHKAVFDLLIDDRAIQFDHSKKLTIDQILKFKHTTYE